jgi:galactonate dehydratase
MSRRSLLRSLMGAGALYGLDALYTCERTDAAAVGPNDQIKVTKIETFVLTNSWVFVKISTDAGVVGWGEMLKDDAKACAAGALEVGDYLIGQDPCRVVHHWQAIHRGAFYRGGPIKSAISSGIDQALWDIKGKVYGVPVYKLLGGPTRDRIRVYGEVSEVTGVNAMKVGPRGGNRRRSSMSRARSSWTRLRSASRRCATSTATASISASIFTARCSRRRRCC